MGSKMELYIEDILQDSFDPSTIERCQLSISPRKFGCSPKTDLLFEKLKVLFSNNESYLEMCVCHNEDKARCLDLISEHVSGVDGVYDFSLNPFPHLKLYSIPETEDVLSKKNL